MKPRVHAPITLALLVGVALLAGGCASAGTTDPGALDGTWTLESFGGANELEPAADGVTTTLTMAGGQATGNGGVNTFSGTYETPGEDALTFGPIASTKMAGPPEAQSQEDRFFKALDATEHFEINYGKLVLSDAGNNTLAIFTGE